jgi:hypothetical protein
MRIARITMTAAGVSNPVPVNYTQPTFNVALAVIPSNANTVLSVGVQYTMDDQTTWRPVNWTQTTTTVTITDGTFQPTPNSSGNPHGLKNGDSITIQGSGSGQGTGFVSFDGTYNVTVTSDTAYTITVTPSQTASGQGTMIPQRWVFTASGIIPAGTAARTYANTTQPATAYRANLVTLTGGTMDFIVLQGLGS